MDSLHQRQRIIDQEHLRLLGACRTLDALLRKSGYRPDFPLDLVK